MKNTLLQFVLENVTDTMKLKTTESVNGGEDKTKIWQITQRRTQRIIEDFFDENLVGYMPGDEENIITIKSWEVIPLNVN